MSDRRHSLFSHSSGQFNPQCMSSPGPILSPAVFVCIFIAGCVWVLLQSVRIYRVTYDVRLRRLFWVGFGVYGAAFFIMWIPDNLACDKVGWLHLHAWFHVCSAIAPYWWIVWATHSFYVHRYAERTGLLRLADGREVEAPRPLMERLGEHLLPESSHRFTESATHEVHALAPTLAGWAELAGVAWAKRRPSSAGSAGTGSDDEPASRPTSPTSLNSTTVPASSSAVGGRRRRRTSMSSSKASDPAEAEDDVTEKKPGVSLTAPGSRGSSVGEPSPSGEPIAIVVTDEPLPMPELRWYGPRNLVMLPYVHLEWKDGQAALRQSLEAARLPGRVPVFGYGCEQGPRDRDASESVSGRGGEDSATKPSPQGKRPGKVVQGSSGSPARKAKGRHSASNA